MEVAGKSHQFYCGVTEIEFDGCSLRVYLTFRVAFDVQLALVLGRANNKLTADSVTQDVTIQLTEDF
jgi:hypothetical protein